MRILTTWEKPIFYFIFIGLLIGHISIIYFQRMLPYVDLPNHMAIASIFRLIHQSGNNFSELFHFSLFPKPNIIHLLFCGFPIFESVESANRYFYIINVIAFPLAGLFLIKRYQGNQWFSLLFYVLIYHYSVTFGFVGYTISIPFLLFFILILDQYFRSRTYSRAVLLCLLFLVLFLCHALIALFSLLVFFSSLAINYKLNKNARILDLFLPLPLIILFGVWYVQDTSRGGGADFNYLIDYYLSYTGNCWWSSVWTRFYHFFHLDNSALFPGPIGVSTGILFSLAILLPALYWIKRLLRPKDLLHLPAEQPVLSSFVICSFFCFLMLPAVLSGVWGIYLRFSVILLIAMILVNAILIKDCKPFLIAALIAVSAIHLVLWHDFHREFARDNRVFTTEFLPDPVHGEIMGGVIRDVKHRGLYSYAHFPNYYTIWKHGLATSLIWEYRFSSLYLKEGIDLPTYKEWTMEWTNDGRYAGMDYIMFRGDPDPSDERFLNDFFVWNKSNAWTIYRKK